MKFQKHIFHLSYLDQFAIPDSRLNLSLESDGEILVKRFLWFLEVMWVGRVAIGVKVHLLIFFLKPYVRIFCDLAHSTIVFHVAVIRPSASYCPCLSHTVVFFVWSSTFYGRISCSCDTTLRTTFSHILKKRGNLWLA